MQRLLAISEDTTAFPWMKRTPGYGLLAMPAMIIALAAGRLTGHSAAGAIAAGSAFTIGFAVFHEALASTVLSMSVLMLGIASATLIGSLGAPWTSLVLLSALVAAVNYGLLASLGPTEGWIGQQSGVFVVVASYFANGPRLAAGRTLMVLAGGTLQIMVFIAFYLVRRKAREPGSPLPHAKVPRRLHELLDCLRAELTIHGKTAAYVARLALALLAGTAIYRYLHVRNGYWIPMTALLVLKPAVVEHLESRHRADGRNGRRCWDRVGALTPAAISGVVDCRAGDCVRVGVLCLAGGELCGVFRICDALHCVSVPLWRLFADGGRPHPAGEYGSGRRDCFDD